jgi:putative oxidoreductase
MNRWNAWKSHLEDRRLVWFDLLRVFLGIALFIRGVYYATNDELLLAEMEGTALFAFGGLAHIIVLAHLAGGLLLALGLLTRVACGVLIPVLIGAVIVEQRTGFFAGGGLELAVFVLVALVLVFLAGPGPLSLDARLEQVWRRKRAMAWQIGEAAEPMT